MRFSIEFDENINTFIVTTKGPMTINGESDMVMKLTSHPRWHESHKLIVDHRLTDTRALSEADITTLSVLIKMFAQHIGNIKTAIVMNSDADLQRVKLWQQQISNLVTFESFVCQDMHSAHTWLTTDSASATVTELSA